MKVSVNKIRRERKRVEVTACRGESAMNHGEPAIIHIPVKLRGTQTASCTASDDIIADSFRFSRFKDEDLLFVPEDWVLDDKPEEAKQSVEDVFKAQQLDSDEEADGNYDTQETDEDDEDDEDDEGDEDDAAELSSAVTFLLDDMLSEDEGEGDSKDVDAEERTTNETADGASEDDIAAVEDELNALIADGEKKLIADKPQTELTAGVNMRYYDRDDDGELVEVEPSEAIGQEVIYIDRDSGKMKRVCGIIRNGSQNDAPQVLDLLGSDNDNEG